MSYIINSYQFKKETPKKKLRKIIIDALSIKNSLIHKNEPFLKPRVQFLYFHHCFDDQIESLEILINRLMIHHEFISYSEGIKILKSKKIDKPYIVICSDDGFKNNLNASRIFAKYKISACFFINPYSINLNDFNSIKEFCAQKLSSPPTEFLSWNDIDYLLKDGHEVGSHAWDHLNLNLISKKESYYQLKKSFDLLKDICGDNVHFSWPYGRTHHFNNELINLVYDVGYTSCASAERGCHIKNFDNSRFVIKRDNIDNFNLNQAMYFISNNVLI